MTLALPLHSKPRKSARRSRIAPTTAHVLMVCCAFVVLVCSSVYAARDYLPAFRSGPSLGAGLGAGRNAGAHGLPPTVAEDAREKPVTIVGADELSPNDPVMRFSDTRVGQVLFASVRSDNCQRMLFDNRTGEYYPAAEIFCGQKPEQEIPPEKLDRFSALRKTFKK